jgi:mannose-6-phosphate isomerase-like protein (cupin superfamily)
MTGYVENLTKLTLENENYRKVLYTGNHSQLVLMSLPPDVEIGEEVHHLDQFISIIAGKGKVFIDDTVYEVKNGTGIVIPAGAKHNVINISEAENLKLYSVYSPAEHKHGTIHKTKLDEKEEHFDGVTSE